jgi:hypothetical protein
MDSMLFAGVATVTSAPRLPSDRSIPRLQTEPSAVDLGTTPRALEQRFGRETLLYFPMDKAGAELCVSL